jgi:hypothetical protein
MFVDEGRGNTDPISEVPTPIGILTKASDFTKTPRMMRNMMKFGIQE